MMRNLQWSCSSAQRQLELRAQRAPRLQVMYVCSKQIAKQRVGWSQLLEVNIKETRSSRRLVCHLSQHGDSKSRFVRGDRLEGCLGRCQADDDWQTENGCLQKAAAILMKIIEMTTNLKMMIHIVRVAISLYSAKSDSAKYEMRNIAMTMTMDVKATLHNFAISIYRVPVFFSTPKYMSLLSIYRQRCSPQTNYILPALPPCTGFVVCLESDNSKEKIWATHIFWPYFQVAHNKL